MNPFVRSRAEARRLLDSSGVSGPPIPVETLARTLGVQLRFEPFEGDISGLLYRDDGQVIIGVNALHSTNRQRFTIAHELGHLLLHSNDSLHVDRKFQVWHRDARSSQAIDPQEKMANAFAAELLMPEHMLKLDLQLDSIDFEDDSTIQILAKRYRVSLQAMIFRLVNLGIVPQLTAP